MKALATAACQTIGRGIHDQFQRWRRRALAFACAARARSMRGQRAGALVYSRISWAATLMDFQARRSSAHSWQEAAWDSRAAQSAGPPSSKMRWRSWQVIVIAFSGGP